uniref:Uncharacterized protein n=1 Tax=Arundo donax TaxID=35708 RepID=A0A0A9DKF7_ARUDO
MRSTDSLPKYHPGQSCRKVKRKELRSQTEGRDGKGDIAGESTEEGQERSDCTVSTDERPDFDGEVSQDGRSSSSNGRVEDGGAQCAMDYGKDGEMEKVLEKQAELIGQYEAEENAQREWEKKFSESHDSTVDSLDNNWNQTKNACGTRETAQNMDKEVVCEQAISSENNLFGINDPSKYLLMDSFSELTSNAAEYSAIEQCKIDDNHDFGKTTGTVASGDSELPVRKDVLVTKRFLEIVEGSGNNLGKSSPTPQGSCDSSLNDRHNKGQGDENSDSGSSYHADARSSERYINAPSVGSPLSDTPKSEVSEWSSSCFHNYTDNQLDTQLHQPSNDDVGGVLEALQRAKMSLREKLSRPSPPSQNILALPAPEDRYTKYDCPVNDMQLSLSRSTHLSQEIQALPAPGDYLNRRILPRDCVNVPVGPGGLFRLPTDSFPRNEMASSDGYGSRFSLTATRRLHISSGYPANHIVSTPSFSQYGSGFSSDTYL